MTLTADELIDIRRHLHSIPELSMQEVKTHAYVLEIIKSFSQTNLEIKELPELPTALLVLVKGSDPQRTLVIVVIWMRYPLRKRMD
jgi:Metal-dependent amidase/aminoacylase/carboxypeptidase